MVWTSIAFLLFSFALGIDFSDCKQSVLMDSYFYHGKEILWPNTQRTTKLQFGVFGPGVVELPYISRTFNALTKTAERKRDFSEEQLQLIFDNPNALPAIESASWVSHVINAPEPSFANYGRWNVVIDSRIQEHPLLPLEKGRLPAADDELAISDMTASLLVGQGYFDEEGALVLPSSWDDLLGSTIAVRSVVGIFRTEYSSCSFFEEALSLERLSEKEELGEFEELLLENRRVASSVLFHSGIFASDLFFRESGNLVADSFFFLRLGCDAPFQGIISYGPAFVLANPLFLFILYFLSLSCFFTGFFLERRHIRRCSTTIRESIPKNFGRGRACLYFLRGLLPCYLLLGGTALVLSEAAFLIINGCAGVFLFSHYMASSFLLAALICLYCFWLSIRKTKTLPNNKPE